jgi:transposase
VNITTVGVDLAKDVITVCTIDQYGQVIKTKDLRASEFAEWLVQLPAGTMVGMEACSSAHFWGRKMRVWLGTACARVGKKNAPL